MSFRIRDISQKLMPRRMGLVIGLITAVSSQLYLNVVVDGFRISPSVILLPFLLMTLGLQSDTRKICAFTALFLLLVRTCILLASGHFNIHSWLDLIPGAFFYIVYGILFGGIIRNKRSAGFGAVVLAAFLSDLGSNVVEIGLRIWMHPSALPSARQVGLLVLVAAVRTVLAAALILVLEEYRAMQVREEREQRFQNMFLVITDLKNEIYLMKKNADEIERVMGNSYRLYEISCCDHLSEDMQKMALSIAKDVHEIKKDYIRIMEGLEDTINPEDATEEMSFRELVEIMESMVKSRLRNTDCSIRVLFDCRDDFRTAYHYALMGIIRNLISNSIEALEEANKDGTVLLMEKYRSGEEDGATGYYVFEVEDNGPGIPEKNRTKIFRMGYTTKFDRQTGSISRGVGLTGVKEVVEGFFNGSITVISEPGKRTVFRIEIPEHAVSPPRQK